MGILFNNSRSLVISFALILQITCYEKTLRKIVRDQSKMVQRPFSDNNKGSLGQSSFNIQTFMSPGFTQVKSGVQKFQKSKISPLSTIQTNKVISKVNIEKAKKLQQFDIRLARDALSNTSEQNRKDNIDFQDFAVAIHNRINDSVKLSISNRIESESSFFPSIDEGVFHSHEMRNNTPTDDHIVIPKNRFLKTNDSFLVKGIIDNKKVLKTKLTSQTLTLPTQDPDQNSVDFLIQDIEIKPNISADEEYTVLGDYDCVNFEEAKVDIDTQILFSKLDIEPSWMKKKTYWNNLYDSRYESLVRSPKWPPLKVILIPRTQVDTIWKEPFDYLFNNNVRKIISNIVKKLNFYKNLTFTWNEVSHFSKWWSTSNNKYRTAVRRLIKQKRFEITTGGWVETDEATSHIFGILHQFMEGHQWLKSNLEYVPEVAWLTNSVTHSPTIPYILCASGINKLITTNLHYSIEEHLAEYQYSDFVWMQNWESNLKEKSKLNDELRQIGNDRYPEHAVLTHYLQFNKADFKACGPDSQLCLQDYDFKYSNRNLDINAYNVKDKTETLLEQYSKTGTLSNHNVIIAPLGGYYHYEDQKAFDYQYNNYWKMSDFVNKNQDIYKATIEFGTPRDYFRNILKIHKRYPTLKGDFSNYADIQSGVPAYWTGFFTNRPSLKILLRYLQANLRSAELLFSFALSFNVFKEFNMTEIYEPLLKARETVARLQDRHVVSGTLTARVSKLVHTQIHKTLKDCWFIQEVSASLLSTNRNLNKKYLVKYVYRKGDFFNTFQSVVPGDQILIFNSLSQERTEVVELTSRLSNIRVLDNKNKYVITQINPTWQLSSDNTIIISRQFYKVTFIVTLPPFTLALFHIKDTFDATPTASTIYCVECYVENITESMYFPCDIHTIEPGDVQVENYKYRLLIDENTGFLKAVIDKATGKERIVMVDYGGFRSSHKHSGMFLFRTNVSRPLTDVLLPFRLGIKNKVMIIISGQITTEVTCIFGTLLQHTVKIYNTMNPNLKDILLIESKVDYEVSPKNRDIELFLSLQSDIKNGESPEFFVDNNSFQYTAHFVNISRGVDSNVYAMTSIAYIQDKKYRLTIVTDHAQGVTALQEGQLVLILDRRVLYNDGRGTDEGIADNTATTHKHIILLEAFSDVQIDAFVTFPKHYLNLPSISAIYIANALNYPLDIYFINKDLSHMCYYTFLPLVKTSLPCDVFLLNYRVILNEGYTENYEPRSALVIFHRFAFSCRIYFSPAMNCNRDSQFDIYSIFRNLREVYRTNLLGTNQGISAKIFNLSNFKSMELMTLRVYF